MTFDNHTLKGDHNHFTTMDDADNVPCTRLKGLSTVRARLKLKFGSHRHLAHRMLVFPPLVVMLIYLISQHACTHMFVAG